MPGGRVLVVECKRPGGKLTVLQAKELARLQALGIATAVVDSIAGAWEVVRAAAVR